MWLLSLPPITHNSTAELPPLTRYSRSYYYPPTRYITLPCSGPSALTGGLISVLYIP